MTLILSGTDGLSDIDGTAATPAIRGTDTNTGIFFPAADTIAFSEGGAEVARFDNAGNLGIGRTPAAGVRLDVENSGDVYAAFRKTSGVTLQLYGSSTDSWVYNVTNHPLILGTNNTERMRITSGGSVNFPSADFAGQLGNSTSYGYWSNSNSSSFIQFNGASNASPWIIQIRANTGGVQLNNGATSWSAISDSRLKNVTGVYSNALSDIAQIEPIKFTWKSDEENKPQVGVLAQSVLPVVPEAIDYQKLVRSEDETEYMSVRYTELIPLMIAAIQELKATVDAQAARIAALENPPVESATNE